MLRRDDRGGGEQTDIIRKTYVVSTAIRFIPDKNQKVCHDMISQIAQKGGSHWIERRISSENS
jgi:hypothetical protein